MGKNRNLMNLIGVVSLFKKKWQNNLTSCKWQKSFFRKWKFSTVIQEMPRIKFIWSFPIFRTFVAYLNSRQYCSALFLDTNSFRTSMCNCTLNIDTLFWTITLIMDFIQWRCWWPHERKHWLLSFWANM